MKRASRKFRTNTDELEQIGNLQSKNLIVEFHPANKKQIIYG